MQEGGYPDAVISTDVVSRKEMDTLLSLDGVEAVSAWRPLFLAPDRFVQAKRAVIDGGFFHHAAFHLIIRPGYQDTPS